jgi:uncharacterized membrane protein YphA (DoxX/SURF4 family)
MRPSPDNEPRDDSLREAPLQPGRFAVGLLWLIAAVWVFAGVSKIVDLAFPEPGAGVLASEPTWADQFPAWLIALVAAAEIGVGVAICVGRHRTGIAFACALLTAFAMALWIIPPEPSQACGCFGPTNSAFDAVPAHAKIAAFGGLHALAFAAMIPIAGKRLADPVVR